MFYEQLYKKFSDSLKLTAVILTLVLLPLLYVYLGSLTLTGADPAEKLKKLNASIVNLDLGTTQENNETLNIGDSIEKTLLESEKGFNWAKDTDENLAQEKLENGNYNVVLTIPKDFTKNIVNLPKDASTNIQAEQITLQTNDAINYETGNIAETVSRLIQAEVRSKITSQMSNKILASIGKIKESLVKATDGTGQLAEGSDKLNDGTHKLDESLTAGTEKIPGYDSETIEKISTHIAKPIEATTHRINPVKHSGIGTLPYYLALGLWLLSLVVFLLVPALLRDRDDQPNLAKSLGVATGIGIAQGLFVALLTNSLFGLSLPKLGGFIFIITLATVAFTLLNQALIGLFGNKGKLISILALIVQMVATGLTYPMEVLPSFLQGLNAMLPMSYVTDAIRIYTSNAGQSLTLHIAVLVITAIIGVIGTVIAANKAKVAETNYA